VNSPTAQGKCCNDRSHVIDGLMTSGPIDTYVVKSLMWQLLNGLSYLHQNWIIHRDLKVAASHLCRQQHA
jgi:serine/threonine protein kinase